MLLKADRLFHTSYHSQAVHIRPVCRVSHGEWGWMPPRGPEEVQVKHLAQCLPRAEPVGSGRCDDDFLGTGHVRRKLECLPGKHSINLCHGP